MAASTKQLALLKKVRSQRTSRVQRLLVTAKSKHEKAVLTLKQLESYRSDYQTNNQACPPSSAANDSLGAAVLSINPLQLANVSRFLGKLDAAVVQQQTVVTQATDELRQLEKQWQRLYLNDKSLGQLIAEKDRAAEKDAIKHDDRASQSSWLSSTLSQSK